jgi:hypothetical protein
MSVTCIATSGHYVRFRIDNRHQAREVLVLGRVGYDSAG